MPNSSAQVIAWVGSLHRSPPSLGCGPRGRIHKRSQENPKTYIRTKSYDNVTNNSGNIFTARCYASAVIAMGLCPSVTSRCSTKTAKRRITQTTRQPRHSSFQTPKIFAKFNQGHHLRGRKMQVGWVKIGDFQQITGYISKTVKDRHRVSIKVEQEVVCALSNGDLNQPYFLHFALPFIAS